MQEKRVVRILYLKEYSGNPADGIDNANMAAFGNISAGGLVFFASASDGFVERGCIKKMPAQTVWQKLRLMRRMRPDYLFGNGGIGDIPFILCKPRGTRYVIDWHTVLLRRTEGAWRVRTPWFVRSFIFSRAWAVVCVSAYIASTVRAQFPQKKIVVILNGVDVGLFNGREPHERKAEQVVFVGTLEPRKRPQLVFAMAFALPHMHFVFVGRDRAPWHFARMIGGISNAEWRSSLSRAEVARLFAESGIFVFPSVNEPAAAVILEAMASGCVPVVSASGGNGEFFTDGVSGFAVPHDEKEQDVFLEKIRLLVADDALRARMGEAAHAEAMRHSWSAVAREYERFFTV